VNKTCEENLDPSLKIRTARIHLFSSFSILDFCINCSLCFCMGVEITLSKNWNDSWAIWGVLLLNEWSWSVEWYCACYSFAKVVHVWSFVTLSIYLLPKKKNTKRSPNDFKIRHHQKSSDSKMPSKGALFAPSKFMEPVTFFPNENIWHSCF